MTKNDNRANRNRTRLVRLGEPIATKVAGISFDGRQRVAWAAASAYARHERCWFELRRDAKNDADANAIAVIAHAGRMHGQVGYLPAADAARLAPIMDAGHRVRITRYGFVGGRSGQYLGIRLEVEAMAAKA